jgi:hypothetical protein
VPKTNDYYELLADIEDDLQRQGLNVTLVPAANILKLVPRKPMLRPLHITVRDWQSLCAAARVPDSSASYEPGDCMAIANAVRENPKIIAFDPPGWAEEVVYFFENCAGLEVR